MKSFYKAIAITAFSAITFFSTAQTADTTKYWTKGGVFAFNFNQVSFTNWAAGGENTLSGTGILSVFENYKKNKTTWDNSLDLAYGILKSGTVIKKNDDKIDLSSKFGHVAIDKWYFAGLVNFKSQFTEGFDYTKTPKSKISNFLAPAYVLISLGMDYKPNADFSLYISPATGKITIVSDKSLADAGAYGVEKATYDLTTGQLLTAGKQVRYEFGSYLTMKYQKDIMKSVNFKTKLDLFSNYSHNPQNVDVNWDVVIGMKVNKYISASIATTLIYDDDIQVPLYKDVAGVKTQTGSGPRTQFREVFGVGFSYKF